MSAPTRDALRRLRRLLKEATGEAKWDDYLSDCATLGVEPMSRREFELHRSERRECGSRMSCC